MTERTACNCMTPPPDYRDFEAHTASDQFSDDRYDGEITANPENSIILTPPIGLGFTRFW